MRGTIVTPLRPSHTPQHLSVPAMFYQNDEEEHLLTQHPHRPGCNLLEQMNFALSSTFGRTVTWMFLVMNASLTIKLSQAYKTDANNFCMTEMAK